MADERKYGFHISTERWADRPSIVVRVVVRERRGEYPINPRCEGEDTIYDAPKRMDGMALSGLVLRVWQAEDGAVLSHLEYERVAFINVRLAKRMLRTLTKINNALTKAEAREPGDMLMAWAKVIGATFTAFAVKENVSMYHDTPWVFDPVLSAREQLRALIKAWPPVEKKVA